MAQWWNQLKDDEERIFGFIQIDIGGSSPLPGIQANLMRTKVNLRNHLIRIASGYDFMPLSWEGDSGVIALLIDQQESYDLMAQCALHLLETVAFFQSSKGFSNLSEAPVCVSIVCHSGWAIFNREGSFFRGSEFNAFRKNERYMGEPNSVVITEAVYGRIASPVLKNAFALAEVAAENRPLYVSPKPSEKPEPLPKPVSKKNFFSRDFKVIIARAFSNLEITVKVNVIIEGMEVDLLLEETTKTGPVKTIIECKSHRNPLGIQDVRALTGKVRILNKKDDSVKRGLLISSSGFTWQARAVAPGLGIVLMTLDELVQISGGVENLPMLPEDIVTARSNPRKWALVIMPSTKESEDVYDFGIRRPLEKSGYLVRRADEIQFTGGVLERIKRSIEEANIIIAEMTEVNPDVYYEVGYAHAMRKTVILIARSAENIPFDLRGMRVLVYDSTRELVEKLYKITNTNEETEQEVHTC